MLNKKMLIGYGALMIACSFVFKSEVQYYAGFVLFIIGAAVKN